MRLIAYMCPSSLEIEISCSFFLHFWQGDSRKSQDLAWAACSVLRKSDQGATNSEFCLMQGPGIECGLSIGFDAFLLSFSANRMLLFTVSLCLCPPGQNLGISNRTCSCRHKSGGVHPAPGFVFFLSLPDTQATLRTEHNVGIGSLNATNVPASGPQRDAIAQSARYLAGGFSWLAGDGQFNVI